VLTSCGRDASGIGRFPAVGLLGEDSVEGGLQAGPDRGDGLLLVEVGDGLLELAAIVRELVCRQRV